MRQFETPTEAIQALVATIEGKPNLYDNTKEHNGTGLTLRQIMQLPKALRFGYLYSSQDSEYITALQRTGRTVRQKEAEGALRKHVPEPMLWDTKPGELDTVFFDEVHDQTNQMYTVETAKNDDPDCRDYPYLGVEPSGIVEATGQSPYLRPKETQRVPATNFLPRAGVSDKVWEVLYKHGFRSDMQTLNDMRPVLGKLDANIRKLTRQMKNTPLTISGKQNPQFTHITAYLRMHQQARRLLQPMSALNSLSTKLQMLVNDLKDNSLDVEMIISRRR